MFPNLDPSFFLLTLVILTSNGCLCQENPLHQNCSEAFRCGDLDGLGYPFWGGDRPAECGRRGFELRCDNDDPRITIGLLPYRVLEVRNDTRTLRVAREDLWSDLCPTYLYDTVIDPNRFDFYQSLTNQIVTLHYGCMGRTTVLPNMFDCNSNGTNTWNLYVPPGMPPPGNGITCTKTVSIRVNETVAQGLSTLPTGGVSLLQEALKYGFWIHWTAEDERCSNCAQSGGLCGQSPNSGEFACLCRDDTHDSTCAGVIGGMRSEKGLSNVQKNAIIGAFSGVGIVLSGLFIFYITRKCRLNKRDLKSSQKLEKFLLSNGSLAPKRYSYNEIKRITKSFSDKLGQGGYGSVYKGWLPQGKIVAVKVLTETDDGGEEFINEVASISRTSHMNIVNLLGFCHDRRRRALVYEFMPNKSLDKFIYMSGQSNPECQLEMKMLYDIAVGVAKGLEYLHRGCNTRIVHFDIKPHNILLDKDFSPKISDFGLAKLFKKDQSIISLLGTRGTIGYIAPEVFSRNFGAISHKSDVYSYGMVLLEMSGARRIDEIEATKSSDNYFFDKIFKYSVLNNNAGNALGALVSEEDEETARKMLLVGLWCTQTAPSDRPSMNKVVEMLEGSLEGIPIPPKPILSTFTMLPPQSSFSIDVNTQDLTEDQDVTTN